MICCKEVIVSDLDRRGNGTEEEPYRVVTQVYEKDGKLIAEDDPVDKYAHFDLIYFARWCCENKIKDININSLRGWLKETRTEGNNNE